MDDGGIVTADSVTETPIGPRPALIGRAISRFRTAAAAMTAAVGLMLITVGAAVAAQYASVVMDAESGSIIDSTNADVVTYPASLTKMMTLYLTFDALDAKSLRPDRLLPVSSRAAAQPPSKLGLRPGKMIRVVDAIRALTTKSANDVAVVLAEALGGTEYSFAAMMTAKARELGMKDTVFRNASGLPDDLQVTTALDMAILSRALIYGHRKHYHYFSTGSFEHGGKVYQSHNRLLQFYPGADGIKTGYIRASGFNLAASAERNGRRLIAVVLGGESAGSRDRHTADLLDRGFDWAVAGGPAPSSPAAIPVASIATAARSSTAALSSAAAIQPAHSDDGAGDLETGGGRWAIQVGVFSDRGNAQRIAKEAAKLLPRLPGDAKPGAFSMVGQDGRTLYRARVVGVTRDAAKAACAALEQRKRDCLAVES